MRLLSNNQFSLMTDGFNQRRVFGVLRSVEGKGVWIQEAWSRRDNISARNAATEVIPFASPSTIGEHLERTFYPVANFVASQQ
jgi:hypothetical protein